ncbi:MAG: putative ABC transporter permease [Bacilli bacterium]|jgi:uncharacterized membrane protein
MFLELKILLIDFTNIKYIILFLIIYSFVGWLLESTYISLYQKKLINSGFLYGPFCPIYGFGSLILIYIFKYLQYNIFLIFITSILIMSLWEYFIGWLMELIFQMKWWDYSNRFFNIKGRICLLNSFFWGILSLLLIKGLHPFIEKLITFNLTLMIITFFLFLYLIIDIIFSIIKHINLETVIIKQYKSLFDYLLNNIPHKKN